MVDSAEHFLTAIGRMGLDPDGVLVFHRRRTAVCTARLRTIGADALEMVSLHPASGSDGARFALDLICLHADIFDVRLVVEIDPDEDGLGGDALRKRYAAHGFHGGTGSPAMARLPCSLRMSVAA